MKSKRPSWTFTTSKTNLSAGQLELKRRDGKPLMTNSILNFIKGAKKFLRYHGIEIRNETFKDKVTLPIADQIEDVPIDHSTIRLILLSEMPLQARLAICIMKDAGTRIGETLQIKVKDVHTDEDPVRIEIRKEYVKVTRHGRKGREVFITSESAELLKQYLMKKVKAPDDRLFGYSDRNLRTTFYRYYKKLGIGAKIEGHSYYQIHPHIFRKFFYSQTVGVIGEQAAHAFMGHGTYLDTYYHRSLEERRADYRRVIPKLQVLKSDSETTDPLIAMIMTRTGCSLKEAQETLELLNERQLPKERIFISCRQTTYSASGLFALGLQKKHEKGPT